MTLSITGGGAEPFTIYGVHRCHKDMALDDLTERLIAASYAIRDLKADLAATHAENRALRKIVERQFWRIANMRHVLIAYLGGDW